MIDPDTVTLGRVDDDGFPAFRRAFAATFGFDHSDEELERSRRVAEVDRLVAARDADGRIVGTSGAYTFGMSLPGGVDASCAGITVVSVRADHRRRGLLTRMMEQLFADADDRREPFAALWASESPIYGRYGFGPAVPTLNVTIERQHGALHHDGPVYEVELLDPDAVTDTLPDLHEAARRQRGGTMTRPDGWWRRLVADPSDARDGAGPLRYALLPGRGFATYRLKPDWGTGAPVGMVQLEDLVALDPGATAALWRFVIDTDLSAKLEAIRRPVDDPIVPLLIDPTRATFRHGWSLWLRLLDLPAAVAARRYLVDGTIVLDVADELRPANAGRWRIEVTDGTARCERTDAAPDLMMDTSGLATVLLGGVRATQLHLASQVHGELAAAAALDRLFAVDLAPNSDLMF